MNVHHRDETFGSDTIYSDRLYIFGGYKCSQLYVGDNSLVSDVHGMKTDKHFVNILEDNIHAQV